MADKDSGSEDGEEEPQITEEEIIKNVSDKVFEAMKVFDPEGNYGSMIRTDKLKEFLEYCEFNMEDQEVYKMASDLDPGQNG